MNDWPANFKKWEGDAPDLMRLRMEHAAACQKVAAAKTPIENAEAKAEKYTRLTRYLKAKERAEQRRAARLAARKAGKSPPPSPDPWAYA